MSEITLIHHLLENSGASYPTRTAVIHGNKSHTYQEIDLAANRLANFLLEKGIRKGDRVGIFFENSIEYIYSYFGILKTGAIAVPLNTELNPDNIQYQLSDCAVTGLISQKNHFKELQPRLSSIDSLKWVITQHQAPGYDYLTPILDAGNPAHPAQPMIDLDPAAIFYTSGSTGKPKGVTLSHLNIVTNTKSINGYLKLTPDDRVLVVLPFHYCYGKSLLHTHFLVGGAVVLDNSFAFPQMVLDTMQRERVTGFSGVPATYQILLHRTNFAAREFPDLRYVTQAGGAMAPSVIEKLIKALPDKKIFIMYGATEASARLAYLEPSELPRKIGAIGKAIPNVELSILAENGELAAPDEVGEIVARGANIMQGYWNDPAETRRVLSEKGYHTGDLGRRDAEGFLYVVGRKRDMIKVGGNRVSAKEIEEILLQHEDIAETAVVGQPDPLLGEAIVAYLVMHGQEIPPQKLRQFCLAKMAAFKVPKHFYYVRELPKNGSGKVMKEALRGKLISSEPASK